MRHTVFYAMLADAADGLEQGATAVAELNPVDWEVDVGAVAGGVIPDAEKVDWDFKTEEVDRLLKYGVVLIWSGGGLLQKHGEGLVEGVCAEEILGPINGAFPGSFDLVKIFKEAKPLFQGAVGEGDFQSAHGRASFVGPEDADAKGAPGVVDKCAKAPLKGVVIGSLLATLFKGLAEDEVVESAALKNLIDAFELATISEVVGARPFGHFRNWTKW